MLSFSSSNQVASDAPHDGSCAEIIPGFVGTVQVGGYHKTTKSCEIGPVQSEKMQYDKFHVALSYKNLVSNYFLK